MGQQERPRGMGGILAISEGGEDHKRPVLSAEIKAKCIVFHGYSGPQVS